jgi:flavin reductase (DIM6/NTAB) family NADH-FMN oxidoreductase RutF
MKIFDRESLDNLDISSKVNLINALPGAKSVNLIGTVDGNGRENLAIFSTVIHLGSNPALLGFIHRPIRYFGHTLKNIQETESYTINQVHFGIQSQAHLTSQKYPQDISEFNITGLKSYFLDGCKAPFVKESKIQCGLTLSSIYEIKENGTFLIVGLVNKIIIDDQFLRPDLKFDHKAAETMAVINFEEYTSLSRS